MSSIHNDRPRVNSRELKDIFCSVGFRNSTVSRIGEQTLRVDLNEPQGIVDPGTFTGSLNFDYLQTQASDLYARLNSQPDTIPGDILQTIFVTNQETNGDENLEQEIIARAQLVDDPNGINNIFRLKRDNHYHEELSRRSYTENMAAILDVISILRPDIEKVRDKEIILFVGPTRSGKSTTMLYLDGTDLELRSVAELGIRDCIEDEVMVPIDNPLDTTFIGHATLRSHTFFPRLHAKPLQGYPDIYLVDFPGFFYTSGWHIRIGLDIILRDIIKAAKSVRLMAVLDKNCFTFAEGDIAKRVFEKLKQIVPAASDHTVVGITTLKRKLRPAFIRILEGYMDNETGERIPGIIKGFPYKRVNQNISEDREDLITGIFERNPVAHVNTTVVSPEELAEFKKFINREESIQEFVKRIQKVVGIDLNTRLGDQGRNVLLSHTSKLYELSNLLGNTDVNSLLGFVCKHIDRVIQLKDDGLTRAILRVEFRVADKLMKFAIGQFRQIWIELINLINEDNENIISREHKELLISKGRNITERIDELLELTYIQIRDCEPQNIFTQMLEGAYDLWLNFFSPLIYITRAGLRVLTFGMEGLIENHINPPVYTKALESVKDLNIDIKRPYEKLLEEYHKRWFGQRMEEQVKNVNYETINIFLEAYIRIIDSSFKRASMVDGNIKRLTLD